MNKTVSIRRCTGYSAEALLPVVRTLYRDCDAPPLKGKRVLIKPNILSDHPPETAVTTHPDVVEAVIRFVAEEGAEKIGVGDAPAMHGKKFNPVKCGIYDVCQRTGSEWLYFSEASSDRMVGKRKVSITQALNGYDALISLPKLKTHSFMSLTGAIKNTFGVMPNLHKAAQHAIHSNSKSFASFLVDLTESILPDFFLMDGIFAMEGDGPSNGQPKEIGALLASTNPLALDIAAARLLGHAPETIPTNAEAIGRGKWLTGYDEIEYLGDDIDSLCVADFKRVEQSGINRIMLQYIVKYFPFLRKLERRPYFERKQCAGCKACVKICPQQALLADKNNDKRILLNDKLCIRCFCCQEVCPENAIKIRGIM